MSNMTVRMTVRRTENGVVVDQCRDFSQMGTEYVFTCADDLAVWMGKWYRGAFELEEEEDDE